MLSFQVYDMMKLKRLKALRRGELIHKILYEVIFMSTRRIQKLVTGSVQYDGAGVKLVRVIGTQTVKDFDPFLMLDAFDSTDPEEYIKGFPTHPHRGIETITYLIHGEIEHQDSLGNKGVITDGGCQWMTAGGGILHQEMPQARERMLGVQLWLNLPKKDKMTYPEYRDILPHMVPRFSSEEGIIKVITGEYKNKKSTVTGDYLKMNFLDIELYPGKTLTLDTPEGDTTLAYLFSGAGVFEEGKEAVPEKHAILFTSGNQVTVTALSEGLRFLLISAPPLRESIAWGGPIVMNTSEELNQAFADLKDGSFTKKSRCKECDNMIY